jgi:hypothetical protein
MPVGEKQKLITTIVSRILEQPAETNKKFSWFINQHKKYHFNDSFLLIDRIYNELKGNSDLKNIRQLQTDAYFGGKWNLLFEFDESQHFSSARLTTLQHYPQSLKTNYAVEDWKNYCVIYLNKADKYRFNKKTKDFNFEGGRTCQRAYLDCFRDLLPQYYGLNPTLRISEFEVSGINEIDNEAIITIKKLLQEKLRFVK